MASALYLDRPFFGSRRAGITPSAIASVDMPLWIEVQRPEPLAPGAAALHLLYRFDKLRHTRFDTSVRIFSYPKEKHVWCGPRGYKFRSGLRSLARARRGWMRCGAQRR